jgi:acyl-homoserine-lactone acylase
MRGAAVRRLLASHPRFTWDEWVHAAFDTRVQLADSLLPGMIASARRAGGGSAERRAALTLLEQWDHHADTASVAVTLLAGWGEQLEKFPAARQGESAVRAAALDSALTALKRDWGTWQVPWGRINRLQRFDDIDPKAGFRDGRPSVAVPGVPGWLGAVFTVYATSADSQRSKYGVAGGTYVSAVEFGPTVRAVAVHVFGASDVPSSPHYFDQAPLFARGEMRPSWIALDEIRAHLERAYHPGGGGAVGDTPLRRRPLRYRAHHLSSEPARRPPTLPKPQATGTFSVISRGSQPWQRTQTHYPQLLRAVASRRPHHKSENFRESPTDRCLLTPFEAGGSE